MPKPIPGTEKLPCPTSGVTVAQRIGLHPFSLPGNAYIDRNRHILGRFGTVSEVPRARYLAKLLLLRLLRLRSTKIFDVLILNWHDRAVLAGGDRPTLRGVFDYLALNCLCRLATRRLIYVRHNNFPHETRAISRRWVQRLIDYGQRLADVIVCHSPVYADQHDLQYVPHPLYEVFPCSLDGYREEYIVFGRIEPYKQIDLLIAAWKSRYTLSVIGPCENQGYLAQLKKIATGKAVRIEAGFKDDSEVASRIAASRGVIIVNDPGSLIVSGTFFYALSCGARLLTTNTPFNRWVATTEVGDYVRLFDSVGELVEKVEHETDGDRPESRSVRDAAEILFGEERVACAWQSLID
jgi:glycosyltransferase involved in cell wall biosynthesis